MLATGFISFALWSINKPFREKLTIREYRAQSHAPSSTGRETQIKMSTAAHVAVINWGLTKCYESIYF